jgi:hypothetical protein
MRSDINDLKSLTSELIKNRGNQSFSNHEQDLIGKVFKSENQQVSPSSLLYFENQNQAVQTRLTYIQKLLMIMKMV